MRKYISQIDSQNFIYPNNTLAEYDVNIVQDINDNSVSGTLSGFTATKSGSNVVISFTYTWLKNNAEPYVDAANLLHTISVHCLEPSKLYYKPWRLVGNDSSSSVNATGVTNTVTYTITPSLMGVTTLIDGKYYFEVRFIGHRAIFPVLVEASIITPSPTPTPTATPGYIPPTPTPTPTPNPCALAGTAVYVA